ncbi:hypothetical protein FRC12_004318 [Ceratobasidium sp. 428]|nr:hypothetical protein FRC09_000827 [Ceratobasidium sp. 395]KAG8796121.1 hypothetical protein FRC12_004318 [Ceratobasidium sp. 428]
MDADYLLHARRSPLGAILGVLTALALVIFLAYLWCREPRIPVLPHLQRIWRALLYPVVLLYRLYWNRDRLFISIPLGTQIETSYYVREEPNSFFSVDEIGILVFSLPGVIWVRYRREHGDELQFHLLLNTLVSVAQTPTPLQTIRSSSHLTSNRAAERLSLDLLARTSLNIIPQSSLPELVHPTPLHAAVRIALLPGFTPSLNAPISSATSRAPHENISGYDFVLAPTPPPSPQSVVSTIGSLEQD